MEREQYEYGVRCSLFVPFHYWRCVMSVPWQAMNRIRSKVRDIVRDSVDVDDSFFTYDYDTHQIVSNRKIGGHHFIFDSDGNLIEDHVD